MPIQIFIYLNPLNIRIASADYNYMTCISHMPKLYWKMHRSGCRPETGGMTCDHYAIQNIADQSWEFDRPRLLTLGTRQKWL